MRTVPTPDHSADIIFPDSNPMIDLRLPQTTAEPDPMDRFHFEDQVEPTRDSLNVTVTKEVEKVTEPQPESATDPITTFHVPYSSSSSTTRGPSRSPNSKIPNPIEEMPLLVNIQSTSLRTESSRRPPSPSVVSSPQPTEFNYDYLLVQDGLSPTSPSNYG